MQGRVATCPYELRIAPATVIVSPEMWLASSLARIATVAAVFVNQPSPAVEAPVGACLISHSAQLLERCALAFGVQHDFSPRDTRQVLNGLHETLGHGFVIAGPVRKILLPLRN